MGWDTSPTLSRIDAEDGSLSLLAESKSIVVKEDGGFVL
jgi:hypothetical protein